jgi:peptidoglycan/LPS O-acetylase OafA/YrhL
VAENDPSSQKHLPVLDGIRGIAILPVIVYHTVLYGGIHPISRVDQAFVRLSLFGWCGVDLFFVLSGFLITGILHDTRGSVGYFRNFYTRRILRIFPLYYGFLVLFFLVLPCLLPESTRPGSSGQIWYWSYLVNVEFARRGWPIDPIIGHFWSLAVEEQFYLFWPLVVLLCQRRRLVNLCCVMITGALVSRITMRMLGHDVAAYVLTVCRVDDMAFGGLLALIARDPRVFPKLLRWSKLTIPLAFTIITILWARKSGYNAQERLMQTIGYSMLALLFASVVALGLTSSPQTNWSRLMSHRFLRFFGRYSYGLYVLHHPIIFLLRQYMGVNIYPTIFGSQLPGQFAFSILVTGASLISAMLSWHLFESQFLKLKARFPYRRIACTASIIFANRDDYFCRLPPGLI